MKRFIILAIFTFLFFLSSASAQFYTGISGGGGISSEVVFRAAIPFEWSIHEHFSLQAELAYIQRENRDVLIKLIGDRRYWQSTISYLEIPILAKARLNVGHFSIYALGGLKAGYGIKLAANHSQGRLFFEERFDFSEKEVRRFDFGLNAGIGLEKHISKNKKIFLDYRFYLGIFDIDAHPESDIFNQGQVFNIGFLLPLDKKNN